MQKYLATAALFPGLFLAWNASKQQNTVFAKSSSSRSSSSSSSKSSSSSSKSSLFSSSKSSSSTSSSSLKSAGSSGSSSSSHSGRSLSHKSSFRRSSVAEKPYTRSQGKNMYVNKRRFAKEKQQNKQLSILGLFGALGLVTRYFYRYEKFRYGIRYIRNALKSSETVNLSMFNKQFEGKLVYGHGPLKIHSWQNKALADPLFGIQASSDEYMRLYRKVEIFKEDEEKPEKNTWRGASYIQAFHPEIFHSCMMEAIILPQKVEIGDYELSHSQLTNLCWDNQKQMSFETEEVDDHYSEMVDLQEYSSSSSGTRRLFGYKSKDNQEKEEDGKSSGHAFAEVDKDKVRDEFRTIQRQVSEITENEMKNMYGVHPFTYANKNDKDITFENDYIYISNNINNPEEGDIRISFHQLKPILHASLLAQQSGKTFTDFQISELKNLKLDLRLFSDGKEKNIKFDVINLIKEGKIEKEDLIKEFMTETKKNSRNVSYILACIIYLIYTAIFDEIGAMINPFNWFGKNAAQRRMNNRQQVVQKRGNGYVFGKNNQTSFLAGLIAVPFSAAHIGAVSLAAAARMYAGFLCGGAVAGFVLYTLYQDYKDDSQLLNSIPEDEEQVFELDETEKEIMELLQHQEEEEKHL